MAELVAALAVAAVGYGSNSLFRQNRGHDASYSRKMEDLVRLVEQKRRASSSGGTLSREEALRQLPAEVRDLVAKSGADPVKILEARRAQLKQSTAAPAAPSAAAPPPRPLYEHGADRFELVGDAVGNDIYAQDSAGYELEAGLRGVGATEEDMRPENDQIESNPDANTLEDWAHVLSEREADENMRNAFEGLDAEGNDLPELGRWGTNTLVGEGEGQYYTDFSDRTRFLYGHTNIDNKMQSGDKLVGATDEVADTVSRSADFAQNRHAGRRANETARDGEDYQWGNQAAPAEMRSEVRKRNEVPNSVEINDALMSGPGDHVRRQHREMRPGLGEAESETASVSRNTDENSNRRGARVPVMRSSADIDDTAVSKNASLESSGRHGLRRGTVRPTSEVDAETQRAALSVRERRDGRSEMRRDEEGDAVVQRSRQNGALVREAGARSGDSNLDAGEMMPTSMRAAGPLRQEQAAVMSRGSDNILTVTTSAPPRADRPLAAERASGMGVSTDYSGAVVVSRAEPAQAPVQAEICNDIDPKTVTYDFESTLQPSDLTHTNAHDETPSLITPGDM